MVGVCLYPVVDYLGWEDERLCPVGLLSAPDNYGTRSPYQPLAQELRRQQRGFTRILNQYWRQTDCRAKTHRGRKLSWRVSEISPRGTLRRLLGCRGRHSG